MSDTEKFDDTDFREVVTDTKGEAKDTESGNGTDISPVDAKASEHGSSASVQGENGENEYEDICYICHRPESKAGKMIKIPNEICICADCMQKTFDSMNHVGFPIGDMSSFGNMPNISMINLSDLQNMGVNMMPRSQKLKKKKSKEEIDHGAAVTTSRNDVNYVVTEYGIAHLKGKTLKQRSRALINIAHPDFREQLKDEFEKLYQTKF